MKKLLKLAKYLGYSIYAVCGVLLLVFLVPVSGWKALTVATGSMNPAIAPGSLVIIHAAKPKDLNVGDMATYVNPANQSQTITHRIVKVASEKPPRTFIFKGDANPVPDPHPIVAGRVVGKVVWHAPTVGRVIEFLRKPLGLALIVIIPGLLVIVGELRTLGKLLYSTPETESESRNEPPAGGPTAPPSDPEPSPEAKPRTRRNLDGMRRLGIITLALLTFATMGHTYAKLTTSVTILHNTVSTGILTHTLPTSMDECKKGGWMNFKNSDGSLMFKNQGQCVAFVQSNGHSHNNITDINITNTNTQSATGNNASNSNATTTNVNVTNN